MEVCQPFNSFRVWCMNVKKRVVFLVVHLVSITAFGQQPEIYNQFFMNPYLYNPAYAGVEGHTVVFLLYHQQWAGFPGSPTTAHASFHTPLKGGIGIGAAGYNFSTGLISRSTAKVSASYLLTMDRKHHLRFGMSIGGGSQNLDFGELDDPRDPAFMGIVDQNAYTIADFGLTYHFGHFNVGFAIPNLIGYNVFEYNSFARVRVNPLDNLMFKANFRGHLNDDIAIEPHVIYRYSQDFFNSDFDGRPIQVPNQFEATVIFHLYHIVWLGGSYRQDNSFAATFGTKIKEKLGIGLSYEIGNSSFFGDLGPTFEMHIGYHIGTRKDHHAHTQSFIKSHRLTAEERAEKEALEREQQLMALQASRPEEPEPEPEVEDTPEPEPVVNPWKIDNSLGESNRTNDLGIEEMAIVLSRVNDEGITEKAVAWVPVEENWEYIEEKIPLERTDSDGNLEIGVQYYRNDENGERELVVKWEPVITESAAIAALTPPTIEPTPQPEAQETEQPAESEPIVDPEPVVEQQPIPVLTPDPVEVDKGDVNLTDDFRSHDELAASDEHLEVKRGNNLLELPVGNYVIAGAFEEFQHAEDFSDELFEKGYHETIVGFLSARGYYYTVIYRSDDLQAAYNARNRFKSRPGMDKIWVLKVNE